MTAVLPQTALVSSQSEIFFPQGEFWSDEPPLESNLHLRQILLLLQCLEWAWRDRTDYFATGNLTVYYSPYQKKSEDFRGPDFFVVLDTDPRLNRRSWVVWQEGGKYPNVIIEILSDSTAAVDRGEKKQIYQDIFRTPDYFWFDPDSLEFEGFHLVDGQYQAIASTEQEWKWSSQLGLYLGIYNQNLRYFTPEGELVLTPEEFAQQQQAQAEQERQRAEQERQRAEQLAAQLRKLGINLDEG
jgi:Uma2 family endonuclease